MIHNLSKRTLSLGLGLLAGVLLAACQTASTATLVPTMALPTQPPSATPQPTEPLQPDATETVGAEFATPDAAGALQAGATEPTPTAEPIAPPSPEPRAVLGPGRLQGLAVAPANASAPLGTTAVAHPGGVTIYSLPGFEVLHNIEVPGGVQALVYTPDGGQLIGATADRLVRWDPASGQAQGEVSTVFNEQSVALHSLAVTADGKTVAGMDSAGTVIGWDLDQPQAFAWVSGDTLSGSGGTNQAFANPLALAPDGQTVLFAQQDEDAEESQLAAWKRGETAPVWTAVPGQPAPATEPTASAPTEGTPSGSEGPEPEGGYTQEIGGFGFTPDGFGIWVLGGAGVELIDAQTGQPVTRFAESSGQVDGAVAAPAGQSPSLVTLGADGLTLWSLDGTAQRTVPLEGARKIFLIDPNTLLAVGQADELRLVDLQGGLEVSQWKAYRPTQNVQYLPGGQLAVDTGGLFQVWDTEEGFVLAEIAGRALSPDGKLAVHGEPTGDGKMRYQLVEIDSGLARVEWTEEALATQLSFSADGRRLVSANNRLTAIDVTAGAVLYTIDMPQNASSATPLLSPDGSMLALLTPGQPTLMLLETDTGLTLQELPLEADPQNGGLSQFAFAVDQGRLVVNVSNGMGFSLARLYEIPGGQSLAEGSLSENYLFPLRFTPDRSTLVGYDWADQVVGLWDAATLEPRGEIPVGCGKGIDISPDGQTLAVAGCDGRVLLFEME